MLFSTIPTILKLHDLVCWFWHFIILARAWLGSSSVVWVLDSGCLFASALDLLLYLSHTSGQVTRSAKEGKEVRARF